MATIIDTTYFDGPLHIAQIETEAVKKNVELFIKIYEPELLTALLGGEIYGNIGGNDPAYVALRTGSDYIILGTPFKWPGIVHTVNGVKRSLIANYIYCKYMQDNASATTGTGEKVAKATNAREATPKYKIARAWNEMVHMNRQVQAFVQHTPELQPLFAMSTEGKYLISPVNVWL